MARTTNSEAAAPAPQRGPSPAEPLPGTTLAATISNRIRAGILAGERPPRSRIRLEELKEEFKVSWSPLREAMSRLVAEGLIQTDEGRAYRVAPVSRADLADVIRLRCVLESMALRASIERGDDAWEAGVLAAHHRLSKLEARRESREDVGHWETWHRAFHDALIGACGSPLLLQLCVQLHDLNSRYRRLFLSVNPFDRDVPSEHRALTAAVMARKPDRACALLEKHIERTGRNIFASMAELGRKPKLSA